ncbi:hypothetical protein TNCV_2284111 [Trichonephila clavipes]|nr:hypothetical protein TNCV_2284111 [Trichonephila clavipes]
MVTLFQPNQEAKREGKMQIRKLLNNRSLEYTRSLQKVSETLNFPAHSRDSKTTPLCTVEGDSLLHMLEFPFRSSVPDVSSKQSKTTEQIEISTSPAHAILCDHAQSSSEICSWASVGGTEKLHLAVAQDLLDTIDVEPSFLQL